MSRTRVSTCAFVVAASLAGCTGTGDVEYAGEVRVTSPDLVYVSPGVQVIADADEPIFYAHGDYWLYRDGYWLRSNDYRRGYARVELTYVPQEIRVIERPQVYVHYRANLGRDRAARTPNMRTRSQPQPQPQPMPQQTAPTNVYPPPTAQQPAYPQRDGSNPQTSPTSPVYQPQTPAHPTVPPHANAPTTTPNDNRREPGPQRAAPPDIDRSAPGNSGNAPGNSGNAPGHNKDAAPTPPQPEPKERGQQPDRSDRATPPGQNKPDDRSKKDDEKKDKKKNEKY